MKLSQLKQQIEELDAKASKKPWKSVVNHAPYKVVVIDEEEYYTTLELKPDDADFIAFSRTALPELLRRLLVAEEALAESRECLSGMTYSGPLQKSWMNRSEKSINASTEALAEIRGNEQMSERLSASNAEAKQ